MTQISKRMRKPDDEVDDGSNRATGASSSLRQESRKRVRLSEVSESGAKAQHHRRRSSPNSIIGETLPAEPLEHSPPPSTQYEIDRDAGFAHLDHADLDDERATQRLLARSQLIGENHASENAIIESVQMLNFMCHENLTVKLGPLINFIVGQNGSGKSAVLTALTLCLGGKASMTNRGGSLKSFIKEGRDFGSLVIRLKNQGPDAYQRDVYGETIIVERNFSKNGSSGFKLKSSANRIISTKKADVEELIEYFQMQIDNPMTVLSQDNARQFLNSASPSQKYKFFVKGVQLEQLDNDYKLIQETAGGIEDKLEILRAQVKKLDQNAKAAKEKVDLVKKHEGLRVKLRMLINQSAWAQVAEQERDLERRETAVRDSQERIEDLERQVHVKDAEFHQTSDAFEQAVEATKQLQSGMESLREEQEEAKRVYDAASQDVQTAHLEQREIRQQLSASDSSLRKIQHDIDEEQRRLENANGGAHAKKLADLGEAQQKAVESKAILDCSIIEGPKLADMYQAADEDLRKSVIPIAAKKKEIEACEAQLSRLRRDAGSVMAGFDPKMPRLLNMIREDAGFKEMPIGPIGLHIKLLKPIWSNVLEKSIGNLLSGFIVTSKQDQLRLSGLMRRLSLENLPVVIGNHHPIDTRGHEPDEKYDTTLRVLDIDNDLVKRQLIINQGIEQTILIETLTDGERILYRSGRPQNVKQCFCLHPQKRAWGVRLAFMAGSGDPMTNPIEPTFRKPRMKTDSDSQITYQEETLQFLRNEINSLYLQQREFQQTLQKHSRTITQHKNREKELLLQLQHAEEEVDRLKEELEGDNIEDGKLEGLKVLLQEARDALDVHGGSYGASGVQKEKLNSVCLSHKRTLDAIKVRIASHETGISKAQNKMKRIQQARQIALQEKNLAFETLHEGKLIKETANQKFNDQKERVEIFIREATQVCARVPVNPEQTPASISTKIDKFSKAVTDYNKMAGGTDAEINQRYEAALEKHQSAVKSLESSEKLHHLMKMSYRQRLNMWRRFQRYISSRSRTNFTYLLSERGFRGKLLVDHKSKLLDIQVEPDETLSSAEGRNTKTLSGGEKSFSNICLLLSVWEAMAAPLRCLDEFDVFMDNVNRDVSTKMIIQAARRSVGRQFIMITPNAIAGNVDFGRDVKITRLGDPRQPRLELEVE